MPTERFLTYRGDIKAAAGLGGTLVFVTVHPEGEPTALYWLDADRLVIHTEALPCGGVALAPAEGGTVYVAGTDRRLYECNKKAPKVFAGPFNNNIAAVAVVAKKRLAVLNGKQIDIIGDDGAVKQTLELPDEGTCLSVDKSASWIVAGTAKGTVAVFDGQDKDEFEPGEASKIHDGRGDGRSVRARGTSVLLRRCRQQAANHVRPRQPRSRGQGPRQHARRRPHGVRVRARRSVRNRQPRCVAQELAPRRRHQADHAQRGVRAGCGARCRHRLQPAARCGGVYR